MARFIMSIPRVLAPCCFDSSQIMNSWLLEHAFMAPTIALVNVNPPPSAGRALPTTTPTRTVSCRPIGILAFCDHRDTPRPEIGLALAHPFSNNQRLELRKLQC